MELQYIYLLKTKLSIDKNEDVFKIGRTKQPNFKRILQYPNGSVPLHYTACSNNVYYERQIINLFKQKYVQIREYGYEYFKGDYNEMKDDIYNIIKLPVDINIILPVVEDNGSNQDFTDKSDDNIINIIEQNKLEMLSVIQENQKEIIDYFKKDNKYSCEKCNFNTTNNYDFNKHLLTDKHKKDGNFEYKYECKNCNKKYISNVGLWKHKKICKQPENIVITNQELSNENVKTLIIQNEEIKEQNQQHQKDIEELKNLVIKLINK